MYITVHNVNVLWEVKSGHHPLVTTRWKCSRSRKWEWMPQAVRPLERFAFRPARLAHARTPCGERWGRFRVEGSLFPYWRPLSIEYLMDSKPRCLLSHGRHDSSAANAQIGTRSGLVEQSNQETTGSTLNMFRSDRETVSGAG